jgi:1-acyl-sn-glycerol-3-phosphate acyltransferase
MKHVKKVFFQFWFSLFGWKIEGNKPDLDKYVIVVAPHTSNWDFFVGLAAKHIVFLNSHFLAKKSLFDIPVVGWFMRSIGGHPVDRSRNLNLVDQVVELYNKYDRFVMTVTPEGTRSYNPSWKTGFYHIAEKAKVPIVLVGFDYKRKVVSFKEPFFVTGEKEKEIEMMKEHFRKIPGKHSEKGIV